MDYLLVDQMGDKFQTRFALVFVISSIGLLKLYDYAMNHKLDVLRQLCINSG